MAIYIEVIDEDSTRLFELSKKPLVLGRSKDCDMIVTDIKVSKHHCHFWIDEHGLASVRDLDSTNGTLLNNNMIGEDQLFIGEDLNIGKTILVRLCVSKLSPEEKTKHLKRVSRQKDKSGISYKGG